MKNIISNFKRIIRFIVSILASREFAFIYCFLGTTTQVAHTYFLTESISSFHGWFKILQATLLSAFISSSLLYFAVIADNTDESKEGKRIMLAVTIFMWIEILINAYYYSRHLIIDAKEIQIFDFIFAILISCLIPVTIKLYAGIIRAKEWFEELTQTVEEEIKNISELDEKIKSIILEELGKIDIQNKPNIDINIEELKDDILKSLDKDIAKIFEKNQSLFLKQTENKIQLLVKEHFQNLKLE